MDAVETLALVVVPAVLGGVGLFLVSGPEDVVAGVVVGVIVGIPLARLRREFHAVRTGDGLERRLRSAPEDTLWARLANREYDDRYDRLLAVVLLGVGIAAFAAVPLLEPQDGLLVVWVVLLGVFGLTTALMTFHSIQSP